MDKDISQGLKAASHEIEYLENHGIPMQQSAHTHYTEGVLMLCC
jgi:hypothetical protein